MSSKIIFNGKSYDSADEMPADARKAYEAVMGVMADRNENGMPDMLEGLPGTGPQSIGSMQIIFEGKGYSSPDDLPAEAHARYEKAMGRLDQDRDGVIDLLQAKGPARASARPAQAIAPQTSAPPLSASAITEERTDNKLAVVGVIIAVLLCAVAVLLAVIYMR